MELGGGRWRWVELDGAGWTWVHGLVIIRFLFWYKSIKMYFIAT